MAIKRKKIKPISEKQKAIKAEEAIIAKRLLVECGGICMLCGQGPDWRGLMPEHHYPDEDGKPKKREALDFKLACYPCASKQHHIKEVK